MESIQQFAEKVGKEVIDKQSFFRKHSNVYDLGLAQSTVEQFVSAVFYASLIPDEGRYPELCLMSYRKDTGHRFSNSFDTPYSPTAIEIAKLSHAVDPESHLCVLSENGELTLGGIHITVINENRDYGYASLRLGNPFKMQIRGPGCIDASWGGQPLIYEAGRIHEEDSLQTSVVMGELAASIKKEIEDQSHGVIESLEDIFNDLVEDIVRQGHGGMLIVAQRPDLTQFSSHRQVDGPLLRQLLVQYWNDVEKQWEENESDDWPSATHRFTVASDTAMLEKCVRSIGQLGGMDGAIVMDFSCAVVAFNAIISRDAEGIETAKFIDRDGIIVNESKMVQNRGSRHQSAVTYAKRVANSFVFVISQDSSITAFHNRGDGKVLYEPRLRVLD